MGTGLRCAWTVTEIFRNWFHWVCMHTGIISMLHARTLVCTPAVTSSPCKQTQYVCMMPFPFTMIFPRLRNLILFSWRLIWSAHSCKDQCTQLFLQSTFYTYSRMHMCTNQKWLCAKPSSGSDMIYYTCHSCLFHARAYVTTKLEACNTRHWLRATPYHTLVHCILPGKEWLSILLAVFMVSPSSVYLGFLDPITDATTGPWTFILITAAFLIHAISCLPQGYLVILCDMHQTLQQYGSSHANVNVRNLAYEKDFIYMHARNYATSLW